METTNGRGPTDSLLSDCVVDSGGPSCVVHTHLGICHIPSHHRGAALACLSHRSTEQWGFIGHIIQELSQDKD